MIPWAGYGASEADLTYQIVDGGVAITACAPGAQGAMVIPPTIQGLPVTTITNRWVASDVGPFTRIDIRGAFEDCDLLTSIVVPPTVRTINSYAFRNCDSLASIVIGVGVERIDDAAFSHCAALSAIDVDVLNQNFEAPDGVLHNETFTKLIAYPTARTGSYTVSNSVQSIAAEAFAGARSLTSVVLPAGLVSIGDRAFKACGSLATIVLPQGLTSLGTLAFQDCTSLDNVVVPPSLTHLPIGAFFGCTSLTSFDIPATVLTMDNSVFQDCSSLRTVTLPSNMTNLADSTFANCDALESVSLPAGLRSIQFHAFEDCDALLSLSIPASTTTIMSTAFSRCDSLRRIDVESGNPNFTSVDGVLFDKNKTTLLSFPGGRGGLFRVPDGVTTIASSAFWECKKLTSLISPPGLSFIGRFAFTDCQSLIHVVFLGDMPTIDNGPVPYPWGEVVYFNVFGGASQSLTFFLYEDVYGTNFSDVEGYPVEVLPLSADNDLDGFPNDAERTLGTNPLDASSRFWSWLEGGRLRFSEIRESATVRCLSSHDLTEWNDLGVEAAGRPSNGGFDLPSTSTPPFTEPGQNSVFFKVVAQ